MPGLGQSVSMAPATLGMLIRKMALLLLAGCLLLYLAALWQWPLSRSEAMYALIPKEMWASGDWLTPTLNGVPYLDKPPLLYWLNLLGYKVFGVSDRAARLVTLGIGLGEVGLTYVIGRRLLGEGPALLGGVILLGSIGFFTLHLQILTDHLVTLGLLWTLAVLVQVEGWPTRGQAILFHLGLLVGFLSKGLIGLVFPVAIVLFQAGIRKRVSLLRLVFDPWGGLVFLLLSVPWFARMATLHPGFLSHHFLNEQVWRFLGERQPPDIVPFPLGGFWLFLFIWLLPWGLLLPGALIRFFRFTRAPERRSLRLLLWWPALILIFFSLSRSRIEYYSLPALPALALVLGWWVHEALIAGQARGVTGALLVLGLLGVAAGVLLPFLEQLCAANRREFYGMFPLLGPVTRKVSLAVPLLALGGALAGWRRPVAGAAALGLLALVLLFFTWRALAALAPLLSDQEPGAYLARHAAPEDVVVMEAIEEFEYGSSLAFYSGRRIFMVQRGGLPQFPYAVAPELDYLLSPEAFKQLWEGPRRVFVLIDEVVEAEPFLKRGRLVLKLPGKRLLVNRP